MFRGEETVVAGGEAGDKAAEVAGGGDEHRTVSVYDLCRMWRLDVWYLLLVRMSRCSRGGVHVYFIGG